MLRGVEKGEECAPRELLIGVGAENSQGEADGASSVHGVPPSDRVVMVSRQGYGQVRETRTNHSRTVRNGGRGSWH